MVSERLRGLDGLRGIAILLVVIYHIWTVISAQAVLPQGSLLTFLYAGNTGVTLFFVLSGFLVSLPFIKSLERGELYSLRRYALHRALRILPPYYVVGAIGIVFTGQTEQLLPMLSFTANGYDMGCFSAVWWSLATEIQFYLLMPFLFAAALHRWRITLLLLACSLAVVAYLVVVCKAVGPAGLEGFELKYRLILSVLGQMPAFVVGLLLAIMHRRCKLRMISYLPGHIGMLALIILLGWVLFPAARMEPKNYIWHAPWYVLPEALLWGAIVWLMLNREPPPVSLLDNKITRFFGKISFSLYLIHMPVVQIIQSHERVYGVWAEVIMAFILSIIIAQIFYWLVENPSLALKNKLSQSHLPSGITV